MPDFFRYDFSLLESLAESFLFGAVYFSESGVLRLVAYGTCILMSASITHVSFIHPFVHSFASTFMPHSHPLCLPHTHHAGSQSDVSSFVFIPGKHV